MHHGGDRPPAPLELFQEVRFCTAPDGIRIAWASTGQGPPLVKAANWMNHLEFDLRSPVWQHWLAGLSATHRLIRYDERGCGLSDWDVPEFSLERWVEDLETVVEAAGVERFPLLGISQGGPVAITYAVRHPERVSHLILYGIYARGWGHRGLSPEALAREEALITLTHGGWGQDTPAYRQLFSGLFVPDADESQLRWFNELQRISTSPANAVRFQRTFGGIEVSELLPRLSVPTLLLHARNDARIPFQEGRWVASQIPGCRFVALEGRNHVILAQEPSWPVFLGEVRRFLGVEAPEAEPIRASSPGERASAGMPQGAGSGFAAEGEGPRSASGSGDGVGNPGAGGVREAGGVLDALRQRKLVQWTTAYVAAAWIVMQALNVLERPWSLTGGFVRSSQLLLGLGVPVVMVLAWYQGEKGRQRASRGELLLIAGLLAAGGALWLLLGR